MSNIGILCLGLELAHRHVLDHALTQRADCLGRITHGSYSCVGLAVGEPQINTGGALFYSELDEREDGGSTTTAVAV